MKVVVKKPNTKPEPVAVQNPISKPRQRGFFRRFVDACCEDIKEKLDKLKRQKKWDGYIPPIEPRYR